MVLKRLSIEQGFLWAQRFAQREWRLLLPVALAFGALPPLVVDLLVPNAAAAMLATAPNGSMAPAMAMAGWVLPLMLLVLLIGLVGSLSITAMALVPAISVSEAIVRAVRRLPAMIGAMLLVAAALLAVAVVIGIVFGALRVNLVQLQALLLGVILGMGLFFSARLAMLSPLIVDGTSGPVAAIRASWHLTQGVFWRILAAILLYIACAGIILFALGTAIGAVLLLLGHATGSPETATVLTAVLFRIGTAIASAGLGLLIVGLYRQLHPAG